MINSALGGSYSDCTYHSDSVSSPLSYCLVWQRQKKMKEKPVYNFAKTGKYDKQTIEYLRQKSQNYLGFDEITRAILPSFVRVDWYWQGYPLLNKLDEDQKNTKNQKTPTKIKNESKFKIIVKRLERQSFYWPICEAANLWTSYMWFNWTNDSLIFSVLQLRVINFGFK